MKYIHQLYTSVAILYMLYKVDIFIPLPSSGIKGKTGFIAKLACIQRQATIHITGALYTTTTNTLDIHTDLLPFDLLIDRKCHNEATRLIILLPDYLLYHTIRKAAKQIFHTTDYSLLHRPIYNAYGMIPNKYKTINIMHFDSKWQSTIYTKIVLNKEAAIEEEEDNKDKIQVYLNGFLIDGCVREAAVIFRRGKEEEILYKHLGKVKEHTVYETELVSIILALQLI